MNRMTSGWWILQVVVACLGIGLAGVAVRAQEAGPDRVAFDAALRAFDAAMFSRAVSELEALVQQFPDSALKPAALERAAFARGEAALATSKWKEAAGAFGTFLKDYPGSTNRLRGALREAYALQKSGDLAGVRDRLQIPDGIFQAATRVAESPAELIFAGWLLLAEARLGLGDPAGALAALESGKAMARTADAQWQRERLRHDAARAAGKADERLAAAEALVNLSGTGEPVRRAEAVSLRMRMAPW
jgi:predicted Zn-dependent protease